ncbi:hypothetical protein WJX81_003016 [Elliptochloris bilobata]|uniref:Uncharacterized protein n=1 Tax=Elliptochloris bilobata TaxID=381761 RepID=A0AAW1RR69_9CHLO
MGRRKERLDAAVKELGDKACSVVGDLCDDDSCKNAVKVAIQKLGGLDILVNNGGVSTDSMHQKSTGAEVFHDALTLHVTSAATMTMAARNGVTMEEQIAKLAKYHAMKRVSHADEVAAAILFLSSNASALITGVQLPVEGGERLGYWLNDPENGMEVSPTEKED